MFIAYLICVFASIVCFDQGDWRWATLFMVLGLVCLDLCIDLYGIRRQLRRIQPQAPEAPPAMLAPRRHSPSAN